MFWLQFQNFIQDKQLHFFYQVYAVNIIKSQFIFLKLLDIFPIQRWNQGLLFHQAFVDLVRSFLLIPLGMSILGCSPIGSCSVLETSFLLLVTASTVSYIVAVIFPSVPFFRLIY